MAAERGASTSAAATRSRSGAGGGARAAAGTGSNGAEETRGASFGLRLDQLAARVGEQEARVLQLTDVLDTRTEGLKGRVDELAASVM